MNDWILQIGVPIITAVLGVLSGNYMTKRQKKKDELETVSKSTQDLIEALTQSNKKINDLTTRLVAETEEKLKYLNKVTTLEKEKISLNAKIDKMQRDIDELKQVISRLSKKESKGNKDNKDGKEVKK